MSSTPLENPALTVALALAAGTLAQAAARRLRLPAIVLLLVMGVLLGPEVLGIVHPKTLGGGLLILVGFAVAVILFEGGMNLNMRRMQREDLAIRRLVLPGALITAAGGAIAVRVFLGWDWGLAALFGTLVIVTGPTVITPLLRRLRVEHSTATVLEAEGVLIDAVGAIIATGAFEMVLSPSGGTFAQEIVSILVRLGTGVLFGIAGGFGMAWLLRFIPEELRNVLTLSLVLSLFHFSNSLMAESGIAAVTSAGIVMGNTKAADKRELFVFKEQLTLMFIGMLFVLLAADTQMSRVIGLGYPGLAVVAALMFVVRPINVALSTYGTSLRLRQRAFIGWIAPRGIVAAAMASLFAVELERHDIEGGLKLRALVFLVIAVTVLAAGLTGGLAARLLGLSRAHNLGWVILGANDLARAVARSLKMRGEDVVCIDTDPAYCKAAEGDGLRVLHANGLESRTLQRAALDQRVGSIGLALTTEVNLYFAQRSKEEVRQARRIVALRRSRAAFASEEAKRIGAQIMFGQPADLEHWNMRMRRRTAHVELWAWQGETTKKLGAELWQKVPEDLFLPLVVCTPRRCQPVTDATTLEKGAQVFVLANRERNSELDSWLESSEFRFVEELTYTSAETSNA